MFEFDSRKEIISSCTGRGMAIAMTTSSASARRRRVKFTSALKWPKRFNFFCFNFCVDFMFFFCFGTVRLMVVFVNGQTLGIKGKMLAKKRYAEKALMKKT